MRLKAWRSPKTQSSWNWSWESVTGARRKVRDGAKEIFNELKRRGKIPPKDAEVKMPRGELREPEPRQSLGFRLPSAHPLAESSQLQEGKWAILWGTSEENTWGRFQKKNEYLLDDPLANIETVQAELTAQESEKGHETAQFATLFSKDWVAEDCQKGLANFKPPEESEDHHPENTV